MIPCSRLFPRSPLNYGAINTPLLLAAAVRMTFHEICETVDRVFADLSAWHIPLCRPNSAFLKAMPFSLVQFNWISHIALEDELLYAPLQAKFVALFCMLSRTELTSR